MEQKEEEDECAWDTLMKSPEGAGKAVLGIISPLWTLKKNHKGRVGKPGRSSHEGAVYKDLHLGPVF